MGNLSDEYLNEINSRANTRLAEFGINTIGQFSIGHIRVVCEVIEEIRQEERQRELKRLHKVFGTKPSQMTDVHGPTGAAIARVGVVTLTGDGSASFDHEGEQVHFRINIDDDESNADRYYRGFNDGYEFVRSREADAVAERAAAEGYEEDQPDESIDNESGINDDDWCGPEVDEDEAAEPDDYDPMLDFGSDDPNAPATPLSREVNATFPSGPFGDYPPGDDPTYQAKPVSQVRPPIGRDRATAPAAKPRTLADADALADELSEIIVAIQEMADAGVMPHVNKYNKNKPEHLPYWQTIIDRHGITFWGRMAEMCGLELKGKKQQMTDARRAQLERLKEERKAEGRGRHGAIESDDGHHTPRGSYIPTEAELLAELQRQAMAGQIMPTVAQFDSARPANWATAQAHMLRLNVGWNELAKLAGLKPNPRGFKATQPAEPAHGGSLAS